MSFDPLNYIKDCGLDESRVEIYKKTLTNADSLIRSVNTSDGSMLPTDDDITSAYIIIFGLGSVLNAVLAEMLERVAGVDSKPRSSNDFKQYNLLYQYIFAGYIKPLNQIISFHEHRL